MPSSFEEDKARLKSLIDTLNGISLDARASVSIQPISAPLGELLAVLLEEVGNRIEKLLEKPKPDYVIIRYPSTVEPQVLEQLRMALKGLRDYPNAPHFLMLPDILKVTVANVGGNTGIFGFERIEELDPKNYDPGQQIVVLGQTQYEVATLSDGEAGIGFYTQAGALVKSGLHFGFYELTSKEVAKEIILGMSPVQTQ